MNNTENNNENVEIKDNKKSSILKILLISFTVIIFLFSLMYLFIEPIVDFIGNEMMTTEYDNLNDSEISKYNVLKVKDVKIVDIDNEEEKKKLDEYFTLYRLTNDEKIEAYKCMKENKLRVTRTEIVNTSDNDLFSVAVMTSNHVTTCQSYNYEDINNFADKNGIYLSHRNEFVTIPKKATEYIYEFEYNEHSEFKFDSSLNSIYAYGYYSHDKKGILINNFDNTGSITRYIFHTVRSLNSDGFQVELEKTGIVKRDGEQYEVCIRNNSYYDIEGICISLNIVNETGEKLMMTDYLSTSLTAENIAINDSVYLNFYLQPGEKVESFTVETYDKYGIPRVYL